jgi:hypothetical protein
LLISTFAFAAGAPSSTNLPLSGAGICPLWVISGHADWPVLRLNTPVPGQPVF